MRYHFTPTRITATKNEKEKLSFPSAGENVQQTEVS